MPFDILGYKDKYKDFYGDAPLEDVAKDAYSRGYHQGEPDFDTWKKSAGIDSSIQEDIKRRTPPTFWDKMVEATAHVAPTLDETSKGEPSSLIRRVVGDPLVALAKGALIGIPETVVGLADIPTLGYAGKGVDALLKATVGGGFKEANTAFDTLLTPETQQAKKEVAETHGFVPTILKAVENPSSIVSTIAESAPSMFGGAGLGRLGMKALGLAVGAKGITPAIKMSRAITAGAVGEGVITAGQNTEQLRQQIEDGTLSPAQVALMAGSGFVTGLISQMSGGLAKRLGITDVDTLLQGVDTGKARTGVIGILKGLMESALTEGAFEELPQSAQEQMSQNLALGKPATEGVVEAGAMGMLAGMGMGLMGAGGGTIYRKTKGDTSTPPTYGAIIQKLQDGAAYTDIIDTGLKTGQYDGKPFTPDNALKIIREERNNGIYDSNDIDKFKDIYPQLRDGLNNIIVEDFKTKISQISFNSIEDAATIDAAWVKGKEDQYNIEQQTGGIGVPNIPNSTLKPNQEFLNAEETKRQYDEFHAPFIPTELLGESLVKSEVPLIKEKEDYEKQAKDLGITFNGIQETGIEGKPGIPLFTDSETKGTFGLEEGQKLPERLTELRESFKDKTQYAEGSLEKKETQSSVTPAVAHVTKSNYKTEILAKYNALLPEFLPSGKKHPGISITEELGGLEGRHDMRDGKMEVSNFTAHKEKFERAVAHELAHELFPHITNKMWGETVREHSLDSDKVITSIKSNANPQLVSALNLIEKTYTKPFTSYLRDVKKSAKSWHDTESDFGGEVIAEAWAVKQIGGRLEAVARKTNPEAMTLADKLFENEVTTRSTVTPAVTPVATPAATPAVTPAVTHLLPKELSTAKPRYSYGDKKFTLKFESDIDRAAYITSQKTPSKRDAEYLDFVKKSTGLNESQIRDYGKKVKESIKSLAKTGTHGTELVVPKSNPQFANALKTNDNLPVVSLKAVQDIFKGQEVIQPGGVNSSIYIKTEGGQYLSVESVDQVTPNKMAFKVAYGREYDPSIDELVGVYESGNIQLVKGSTGKFELTHESVHFMEDIGILNENEITLLQRHIQNLVANNKFKTANKDDIGGPEDRANFLGQELTKGKPQGLLGRILNKIQDFIDKLVNAFGQRTVKGVVRDIETGDIYSREGDLSKNNLELYMLREKLKPFFSQLESVIDKKMGGKMPVDQLVKMLKSNGVTDAEIDNVIGGIRDEGGTVTKQLVIDEIRSNTTEFKDIILGKPYKSPKDFFGIKDEIWSGLDERAKQSYQEEMLQHRDVNSSDSPTHYEQYSEPGYVPGSYREMFVTGPSQTSGLKTLPTDWRTEQDKKTGKWSSRNPNGDLEFADYPTEEFVIKRTLEKIAEEGDWKDGHSAYSNINNPIVRIRYNDRIVGGTRDKISQEVKDKKLKDLNEIYLKNGGRSTDADIEFKEWLDENDPIVNGKKILFVEEFQGPSPENQEKMPDAFKKRIYGIGVKRVLALAKEGGYDGVAWTTGEMQASRYDLSKQIERVNWIPDALGHGAKTVVITPKNSDGTIQIHVDSKGLIFDDESETGRFIDKQLNEVIGKDIAKQIMEKDKDDLTGLDLKVGGEGLKSLYDKQIPSLMKKYGKGEVEEVNLSNGRVDYDKTELASGNIIGLQLGIPREQIGNWWSDMTNDERTKLTEEYYKDKPREQFTTPYIPITDKTPVSYPQYSSNPKVLVQPWDIDPPSKIDNFLRTISDRFIDLRKVVSAIDSLHGQLTDMSDPSLQQTLYSAKVKNGIDRFLQDELRPMLKELALKGGTLDGFHEYILNRHAPEANAYIASINPELQDGGSGVLTADADAYMTNLDPKTKLLYDKLSEQYDNIAKKNLQILVDGELESQKTIDIWTGKYQYYAPLYRTDMEKDGGFGTGKGFSVVGPSSKARHGSTRDVTNVIASLSEQRERYLTRVYKNNIDKALVTLVEQYPNPDFWNLAKPTIVDRISADPLTKDQMISVVDLSYMHQDNIVMARVLDPKTKDIIQRGVEFNFDNERAVETVKALKNLDMDKLGTILGYSAKVTRFVSSMNTQYNVVFGIVNFVRDFQAAMINLSTTEISGKQIEVAKGVFPALKVIYSDLRSEHRGELRKITNQLQQDWQDFREHGGLVGYRDMYNTKEDRIKSIQKEMTQLSSGMTRQFGHQIVQWLSDYNTMIESGIRLSAYQVGVKSGMTKDRAAAMAKDLTLDFGKKGQIALQAGAMYAFFNASVRGIIRTGETLVGPLGKKIVAGGIMFGILQALVLDASDLDADEPPEFVKERSFVIPLGNKRYITIPLALGFHVLPNIGRITTEWAMGGFEKPMTKFTNLLGTIIEATNPMGSSGFSLQTLSPTPIDPIVALAENKDWTGKTIYKENSSTLQPTPGFSRARDNAKGLSYGLSWALNKLSGGSNYNPGMMSPTPEQIDYLGSQIGGGVTREVTKAIQATGTVVTGEELPSYKMPIVSRFYGSVNELTKETTKFYDNVKEINKHELEINGLKKANLSISEYMRNNPNARLVPLVNRLEQRIEGLRKRRELMEERKADKEVIKKLDATIQSLMKTLNDRVRGV